MYLTAAKRLLASRIGINGAIHSRLSTPLPSAGFQYNAFRAASTDPNSLPHPSARSESTKEAGNSDHSSSSSWKQHNQEPPRVDYKEEQTRLLRSSLVHVPRLGWTEEALMAGARDIEVSPSIVGAFEKKEATLVEFFMDECLQLLMDRIESDEGLKILTSMDRISKLVKIRLEMQIPYISKWPQALSIQAHPLNVRTSFNQRATLIDEIWHSTGDERSDIDLFAKRTVLGGIYSTTEIYMLTDNSPEFRDTWAFLDERVKDAFDLRKTIQEAKYLVEAVGAGMEKSLRGFVNRSSF